MEKFLYNDIYLVCSFFSGHSNNVLMIINHIQYQYILYTDRILNIKYYIETEIYKNRIWKHVSGIEKKNYYYQTWNQIMVKRE